MTFEEYLFAFLGYALAIIGFVLSYYLYVKSKRDVALRLEEQQRLITFYLSIRNSVPDAGMRESLEKNLKDFLGAETYNKIYRK